MAGARMSLTYLQLSRKTRWDSKVFQRSVRLARTFTTPPFTCVSTTVLKKKEICPDFVDNHKQLSAIGAHYSTAALCVAADDGVSLSPAVKYLVNTNSISDLSLITPSGPKSRILKGDVLRYLDDIKSGRIPTKPTPAQQSTQPILPTAGGPIPVPVVQVDSKSSRKELSYVDVPLDEVQRSRAEQMVQSKLSTPHLYATATCNVHRLAEVASTQEKESSQSASGVLPFLVKAAALTLERLPECNAVWSSTDIPHFLSSFDVSVTVGSLSGAATAHLSDVHRLSARDIKQSMEEVIQGATSSRIEFYQRMICSPFSIVYLGDSGVSEFTSVLGPDQSAVLSLGSLKAQPRLGGDSPAEGTRSSTLTVTLTVDARVFRDELACRWLDEFKRTVEAPELCGLL